MTVIIDRSTPDMGGTGVGGRFSRQRFVNIETIASVPTHDMADTVVELCESDGGAASFTFRASELISMQVIP